MRLSRRLTGKKSFVQPNFWALNNSPVSWSPTGPNHETLEHDYLGYVQRFYKDNGVVYACIQTRQLVFSEARFAFQRLRNGAPHGGPAPTNRKPRPEEKLAPPPGNSPQDTSPTKPKSPNPGSDRPNDLFSTPALKILEKPWPGGETGNLLGIMEADASIAGNSYITYTNDEGLYGNAAKGTPTARLVRMRPDHVQIVVWSPSGNPWALDARIGGYVYRPPLATADSTQSVILMPEEVAHYAPIPDPEARWRGMTWLTPVIREIQADRSANTHKKKFFDSGATLGHIIRMPVEIGQDDFDAFVKKFKETHEGFDNAYKTLFLGGGADVSTVGVDLRQLEFTQTQGHGETRIAAASGVPPVIVGLSEGLQAATYSNYSQARRRFADGTLRPLWRMACAALSNLIDVPADARLWYDDSDISFLRDDKKEEAEIVETTARAAKALIESGWEDDSIKKYLVSRDPADLEHTGLVSVQLLPPGTPHPIAMGGGPGGPGTPGSPNKPNSSANDPKKPKPTAGKPKPASQKPAPRKSLGEEDHAGD